MIFKIILTILFWVAFNIFMVGFERDIKGSVAINQLQNDNAILYKMESLRYIEDVMWIGNVAIPILGLLWIIPVKKEVKIGK